MGERIAFIVMMGLCGLGFGSSLAANNPQAAIWSATCAIWVTLWYRETIRKSPKP